jgi:glycosyltransferase involved in cell wall biosynthesis
MRIAFDATAMPRLMAGAAVYTYELARALAAVDSENEYVIFARGRQFDDLPAMRPGPPAGPAYRTGRRAGLRVLKVRVPSRLLRLLWEQTVLPWSAKGGRRLRIDVLHSPHHTTPLAPCGYRRVVTIHDLTFFLLPERYPTTRRLYFQVMTRLSARVADAIIVPSEAVKGDVMRILGLPPERLFVIPEAAGPAFRPQDAVAIEAVRRRYGLEGPFLLSVGSLEPGKNRERLLQAFARLRAGGLKHTLVVAGQRAWRYEGEAPLARRLGLADSVRFLGHVPQADLPALYSAAEVFVFPSLYEGFGLPALEAMACGTPVVASNVSALPEVVGDAALQVSPLDVEALADAMERLLRDGRLRSDLRERGLARAARFSWEKAARQTVEVYRWVVEARKEAS